MVMARRTAWGSTASLSAVVGAGACSSGRDVLQPASTNAVAAATDRRANRIRGLLTRRPPRRRESQGESVTHQLITDCYLSSELFTTVPKAVDWYVHPFRLREGFATPRMHPTPCQ